ncbi:MAG: chalcone isomerase family protein [Gemmataceae bacterium]
MQYSPRTRLSVAALIVCLGGLTAGETVAVSGSNARFATGIEVQAAGKPVWLRLTGTAMRKKAIFNVYAMASYLQDGVAAKSADQLAAANGVKMLHLVMERDVSGRDMADAIQAGVRLNHPANAFAVELKKVADILAALDLRKGDQVMLTAIPQIGLRCQVVGKTDATIENPAFARAIWDIYLGRQNLGESVKAGLASRL